MVVAGVMPKSVLETTVPTSIGAASSGRWHAVIGRQATIQVWYTLPNQLLAVQEQSTQVIKLQHYKLSDCTPIVHLLAHGEDDELWVYAVHPATGVVVVWKLARDVFRRLVAPPALTLGFLDLEPDEMVTTLAVAWESEEPAPTLVAGTDQGRLMWLTQTQSPNTLHAQLVETSSVSVFTRLWSSTTAVSRPPVRALVLKSPTSFLAIDQQGAATEWQVTLSTGSHKCYFGASEPLSLVHAIAEAASVSVLGARCGGPAGHCHVIVRAYLSSGESRLYWLRLHDRQCLLAHWLNRFVAPEQQDLVGLVVADNGLAYAGFSTRSSSSSSSLSPLLMALTEQGRVYELDWPERAGAMLSLTGDVVTHGVCVWTRLGYCVRVSLAQASGWTEVWTPSKNPVVMATLVPHLLSSFYEFFKHPTQARPLPPSLTTAELGDVEAAVLQVARQLQAKGRVSMAQGALEAHSALINLLQQAGLYRNLSASCRWQLLAIGQQVAAFKALGCQNRRQDWEANVLDHLEANAVAEWLDNVQRDVLNHQDEARQRRVLEWLSLAVTTAMSYRQERGMDVYGLASDDPPKVADRESVPVWTSDPTLELVLITQVKHWSVDPSTATSPILEDIVKATLASTADSAKSFPPAKEQHVTTRALAIELLRSVKGLAEDELAFELCKQYRYYAGLCEIAVAHEHKRDRNKYQLEPLFEYFDGKRSGEDGDPFKHFVLKWHCDRDLPGHVLKYGEFCPGALKILLEKEEKMRLFRWMDAVGKGDFNKATMSLMENAKSPSADLSAVKLALAIASTTNLVVEQDEATIGIRHEAKRRRVEIENMRELVVVQEEILDGTVADRLYPAKTLIEYAIEKVDRCESRQEKARALFLALAVCQTFHTPEEQTLQAATVWFKAIMCDFPLYQQWLTAEMGLSGPAATRAVQDETVFGALLAEMGSNGDLATVQYTSNVQTEVMRQKSRVFEGDLGMELLHLLRTASDDMVRAALYALPSTSQSMVTGMIE